MRFALVSFAVDDVDATVSGCSFAARWSEARVSIRAG
jgi:hypothetical protein